MDTKEHSYSATQSFKVFFYTIILGLAVSLAFNIVVILCSNIMQVDVKELLNYRWIQYLQSLIIPVSFLGYLLFYHKRTKINLFKNDMWERPRATNIIISILVGFVFVLMLTPIIGLINFGLVKIGYVPTEATVYSMTNWWQLLLGIFSMALLPAIAEELIFRGVILRGLLKEYSPAIAVGITTFLFVIMHGSLQQTVYQLMLGIALGYLAYKSNKIIYPIILHFINNLLVLLINFFNPIDYLNFDQIFYTNFFQIVFPILIGLLGVILVFVLFFLLQFNSDKAVAGKNKFLHLFKRHDAATIYMVFSIILALSIWISDTVTTFINS